MSNPVFAWVLMTSTNLLVHVCYLVLRILFTVTVLFSEHGKDSLCGLRIVF